MKRSSCHRARAFSSRRYRHRACRCRHRLEPNHDRSDEGRQGRGQPLVTHIGDGACRNVRRHQFGTKPLHTLRDNRSCRAWSVGRGGCGGRRAANSSSAVPHSEDDDRGRLREFAEGDSRRSSEDSRHCTGRTGRCSSPGGSRVRRHQRARYLPAAHQPRCVGADDAAHYLRSTPAPSPGC